MSERGADSGAQDYDDMVFIPYQSGRARVYQAQTQPDYVVVEASSSERVHEAEQSIRSLLLARHGEGKTSASAMRQPVFRPRPQRARAWP
jgi:macrolide transport system ATP-binding/permease protein